ncbi:peptide chain release factor N(5)-glutamine methyltransferase [Virgibacillus proomii]|nr:peptide chain release factor N(5)-glutamine methyltransferase [Virgibacillus proomii]
MKVMKQYEVLQWASLFLKKHQREERVAEILLQHYLQVSSAAFYMNMQEPVSEEVLVKYKRAIQQHAEMGIPVQHIMGFASFYGRKYKVNKHVLIPRPETEELVHFVIQTVKKQFENQALTIVDIGTGSGVIAITLALELKNVNVYATDISKFALTVARENAKKHQVSVQFLMGDFLEPVHKNDIQPDIIVSNPPYIAQTEASLLRDTVKNFDPKLALFAENEGLAAYQQIINQTKEMAVSPSFIAFEIGHRQAEAVSELVHHAYPNSDLQVLKDINRKDRIVAVKI